MKIRYLLFLFLFTTIYVQAQDIIVTQYGDTLDKKIISSTKRYLFYLDSTYYGKYRVKGMKKRNITEFKMNAYRVDRNTAMINQRALEVMGNAFMLQGGLQLSFLPLFADSTDPSSWKSFLADLRIGFSYNVSFHIRMRPHSFIGVVLDDDHSSAFSSTLDLPQSNNTLIHLTDVKSTIGMFYLGPEYMLFLDSKKFTHFFVVSGGVGYARFNWVVKPGNSPSLNYRATGFGVRASISKTWAIGRTIIIGPNFKFVVAGVEDEYHNAIVVPRINLGLSLLLH